MLGPILAPQLGGVSTRSAVAHGLPRQSAARPRLVRAGAAAAPRPVDQRARMLAADFEPECFPLDDSAHSSTVYGSGVLTEVPLSLIDERLVFFQVRNWPDEYKMQ